MVPSLLSPTATPSIDAAGDTVQPATIASAGCSTAPLPRDRDILVTYPGTPVGEQLGALQPGAPVAVRWSIHETDRGVLDVIGANISLVHGARISSDVTGGTGAFFSERAPRTAIGIRPDGDLLLVIVDGRQSGYSIGMTPRELAQHLISLGAIDAANLDGGGSSALAVHGLPASRPSDAAGERAVGSGLVVVRRGTPAPARVAAARAVGGNPELDAASLGGYRTSSAG